MLSTLSLSLRSAGLTLLEDTSSVSYWASSSPTGILPCFLEEDGCLHAEIWGSWVIKTGPRLRRCAESGPLVHRPSLHSWVPILLKMRGFQFKNPITHLIQFQEGAGLSSCVCSFVTRSISNLIQTVNDRKVSGQKRGHTIGGNPVTLKQRPPSESHSLWPEKRVGDGSRCRVQLLRSS